MGVAFDPEALGGGAAEFVRNADALLGHSSTVEGMAALRTAFAGHRLDPAVGRRYRDTVLANGGQVLPEELVRQFLGRPSNNEAFFQFLAKE